MGGREVFLRDEKMNPTVAVYLPPRPICIKCSGSEMEWVEMKGTGKLADFACIGIGPGFMREEVLLEAGYTCEDIISLKEQGVVG
jgi:hypothetical protein